MTSKFEVYKITLDFLKGNKILLAVTLSLLGGNVYQANKGGEVEHVPVVVKLNKPSPVLISSGVSKSQCKAIVNEALNKHINSVRH